VAVNSSIKVGPLAVFLLQMLVIMENVMKRPVFHLLTAIGLTPGGSSTVHIYTQTIHRTTHLIWEDCGPCPVFARYTLAFALQVGKNQGKTSVRVVER
jgi:hypothetical protein